MTQAFSSARITRREPAISTVLDDDELKRREESKRHSAGIELLVGKGGAELLAVCQEVAGKEK